ncbi:MAG: tail fiber domain-containing protein [Salinivenus sp.]
MAGQNEFVARASGGVEFYTSSDLSSGAELPAGSGSWSTLSDSTMKENMSAVDPADILAGVTRLPVHQWNYKTQSDHVRHMGPTAQTFHSAFGLGANNTTISTVDIDGVNMAAIQALAARTEALQSENEALEARVARLEQLVETRSSLPAGLGGPLGMSLLLLVVIGGGAIVWRVRAAQA